MSVSVSISCGNSIKLVIVHQESITACNRFYKTRVPDGDSGYVPNPSIFIYSVLLLCDHACPEASWLKWLSWGRGQFATHQINFLTSFFCLWLFSVSSGGVYVRCFTVYQSSLTLGVYQHNASQEGA